MQSRLSYCIIWGSTHYTACTVDIAECLCNEKIDKRYHGTATLQHYSISSN